MSIYFSPSKPIAITDLFDGRLTPYGITVHQLPHDHTRYQVTDGVNSMFLDANSDDALSITDMTRYAGNDVDFIIEALQESYHVVIYSEYEPQYWGGTCPWDLQDDDLVEQDEPAS